MGSTPTSDAFFCSVCIVLVLLGTFRGSIVVSIPACHAGDPDPIPGSGVSFPFFFFFSLCFFFPQSVSQSVVGLEVVATKIINDKRNGYNTALFPGGPPPQY